MPSSSVVGLEVEGSPEQLQRFRELRERREELLAQGRLAYPTPGALAHRLDPGTVQTPALDVIDGELLLIRDALRTMYERRRLFAEHVNAGVDETTATRRADEEVPAEGNTRLVLSMPPQEGKTERIGRRGVLWFLQQFPGLRVGIVSYDGDHAARISYMVRADIELCDGTDRMPDLGLRLARDQKAISRWLLASPHGGGVYAIGVGGGLTGRPLDLLVIDDPVKDVRAADSLLLSSQAWDWWQTVARPRLAPGAPTVLVQTRWHEADLTGRMLLKQREDEEAGVEHHDRWRKVNIPAQADHRPEHGETDVLGRAPGEFMASARGRTPEQWAATKAATAPRFWAALYQGSPSPDVGEVWLKTWWRRYDTPMWEAQPDGTFKVLVDQVILSIDCAFKDKKDSDYVTMGVWAKRGADSFLIYQLWRRLNFSDTCTALKRIAGLFPQASRKLVEDKANGTAVIEAMRKTVPGIIPIVPVQHKRARAEAVSPFIRAGNVHLPTAAVAAMHSEIAWDVDAFVLESTQFPNGANDDQVDQASQALAELYLHPGQGHAFMAMYREELAARKPAVPAELAAMPRAAADGPAELRPGCRHRWQRWPEGDQCVNCGGWR